MSPEPEGRIATYGPIGWQHLRISQKEVGRRLRSSVVDVTVVDAGSCASFWANPTRDHAAAQTPAT